MSDDNRSSLVELLTALTRALSADTPVQEPRVAQEQPRGSAEADGPALISVPEAARILGLSRASAYRYAAGGQLPVKRFGRRVYVVRARLAEVVSPDSFSSEVDAA